MNIKKTKTRQMLKATSLIGLHRISKDPKDKTELDPEQLKDR